LFGIHSSENLLASDYKSMKEELVNSCINPHFKIFYSIKMGLHDKPWNKIKSKNILLDLK